MDHLFLFLFIITYIKNIYYNLITAFLFDYIIYNAIIVSFDFYFDSLSYLIFISVLGLIVLAIFIIHYRYLFVLKIILFFSRNSFSFKREKDLPFFIVYFYYLLFIHSLSL